MSAEGEKDGAPKLCDGLGRGRARGPGAVGCSAANLAVSNSRQGLPSHFPTSTRRLRPREGRRPLTAVRARAHGVKREGVAWYGGARPRRRRA